jgi:asparagine synthase (glutamine-hydrolysing)
LFGAVGGRGRHTAAVPWSVTGAATSGIAIHGDLDRLQGTAVTTLDGASVAGRLLDGLRHQGDRCLEGIAGEFCLAHWDDAEGQLLLATDHFRVHPLFLYEDEDCIVFASRMKALLASGRVQRRTLAPEALIDVVAASFIPSPGTIFREVRKVPPGHAVRWSGGELTIHPYWDLTFADPSTDGPAELARQLKERLREAVALRAPLDEGAGALGVFLSGGIDSSTVAGVLTQVRGGPVRSFSIGFDEPRYNELEFARIAARAFGADHHEYCVTTKDTLEALPAILDWIDEPFANASCVPTYYCARLARDNGVTTMLAGDGGDELFAGNPWYGMRTVFDTYRRIPGFIRNGLIRPAVRAAARTGAPLARKAERYVDRASLSYAERIATYGFFQQMPPAALFTPDFLGSLREPYRSHRATLRHWANAPAHTDLDRQLYVDLKLVIGDNDLIKVTRMTEAAGVAVRFPMLDRHLAEFAARVPARIKMPGKDLRYFFKRSMADLLPPETLQKRKHGFGLPIPVWLRTDPGLRELMHDLVAGPRTLERGIFREAALRDLLARHEADTAHYYGAILWNLMIIELWLRKNA